MEMIFLGTSSMVPTKERNQTSVLVRTQMFDCLIDCGEATQRQIKIAKLSPTRIQKILLTHWHGDHVLGLPGFLMTLANSHFQGTLEIYGPKGTKKHIAAMNQAFLFESGKLQYKVIEVEEGIIYEDKHIKIECASMTHAIPCVNYAVYEHGKTRIDTEKAKKLGLPEGPKMGKLSRGETVEHNGKKISPTEITYSVSGRKMAYITDTEECGSCYTLAKDADILICEATYGPDMEDLAHERAHLTSTTAANIAKKSNVKKLFITHFSQRYRNTKILEEDAKKIFPETIAAEDFMHIKIN